MRSKRTVMEIADRAKGEGLQRTEQREPSSLLEWPSRNGRRRSQIPLLNAAGLQIRPNGYGFWGWFPSEYNVNILY